jgi:hypothetical protein
MPHTGENYHYHQQKLEEIMSDEKALKEYTKKELLDLYKIKKQHTIRAESEVYELRDQVGEMTSIIANLEAKIKTKNTIIYDKNIEIGVLEKWMQKFINK